MNVPIKNLKLLGIVGLVAIVLIGIFLSTGINPRYLIAGENANKTTASSDISPEPSEMPLDSPSDTSSSSSNGDTDTTVQTIQPTVTSDPVVSCTVQHVGTVQMTQSSCNASFACQIGDSWVLYSDRNKCAADQKSYYQELYGYTSTSTNNSASAPTDVYPTIDTSADHEQDVQNCIGGAKAQYQQSLLETQRLAKAYNVDPSTLGTDGKAANLEAQQIYACQH